MTEQLAFTLRDEGHTQVTAASDDQDIAVVDQLIREHAALGRPFSINDIRPLVPALRSMNLLGARFRAAALRGDIAPTGRYPLATYASSRGRRVTEWRAAF